MSNFAFDDNSVRKLGGWALLALLAAIWIAMGYFVPPVGMMLVVVHLVCALLDAGMNGWENAEFAHMNLGGCVFAGIGLWLSGVM